jgi:hypothetical protein
VSPGRRLSFSTKAAAIHSFAAKAPDIVATRFSLVLLPPRPSQSRPVFIMRRP